MLAGTWTMSNVIEINLSSATRRTTRKATMKVQVRCPGSEGENILRAAMICNNANTSTITVTTKSTFTTREPLCGPPRLQASRDAIGAITSDTIKGVVTDLDLIS